MCWDGGWAPVVGHVVAYNVSPPNSLASHHHCAVPLRIPQLVLQFCFRKFAESTHLNDSVSVLRVCILLIPG